MMTVPELLHRAKRAIESGEISLRAAAEDIAAARERGATQRQIAESVGKSAARRGISLRLMAISDIREGLRKAEKIAVELRLVGLRFNQQKTYGVQ